ncbi:MAG: DUF4387 family protein [Pseudomonadota bacterium]
MSNVRSIAEKVRSKNAGPFWVTIDIFCGSKEPYDRIRAGLNLQAIAERFDTSAALIQRFDLPNLHVIKISVPRPQVQGTPADRDMHGAAWAALVAELEVA